MFRLGSQARFVLVFAALVGLTVSSTHTAPMAQGMPTFGPAANYPLGNPSWRVPVFMALGDLNGDGYADAVTSDGDEPSRLRILFNDGAGGFGGVTVLNISGPCPSATTCANNVYRVEIADFNLDGWNDIVAVNNHSQNITVVLGTGGGAFAAPVNYSLGDSGRALAVGDINNDGYPDIVAGSANQVVRPFINNGNGTFTVGVDAGSPLGIAVGGDNRQGMAIADFNGDGKADIAVGNRDSNNVLVLFGNGAGGFTFSALLPDARGATVRALDVNNDGLLDIVASQSGASAEYLAIYVNNGTGTFAAPAYVLAGGFNNTFYFDAADINLDGNVDIVTSQSDGTKTLTLLVGDGMGGFTSAGTLAVSTPPGELRIADLNNDGALDIAVTNRDARALARYLNTTPPPLCGAGTYSATGNEPCVDADPGYFVATEGAEAQTACPVGSYSSVTGAEACEPAPAGSYVDTVAATGSLLCPAGSYSATVGSASCTLAAPGFFVPAIGASSQTACPSGFGSDAGATACYPLDNDGDGVNNDEDAYPNSNMNATVGLGACATTVANQVLPNGATFNDLLATAAAGAANHGKLVSAVTQLSNGWKNAGLISGRDHGAITSCTARSK